MKKIRALIALAVIALLGLAIWVARTGQNPAATAEDSGTEGSAYDYDARDVVVRQMGPDGKLQYELEAKQISQLPRKGRISATDLTIHYDPPGSEPGGSNRWTLTADRADLPDDGRILTMEGNVKADGLPPGESVPAHLTTQKLSYNLAQQELAGNSATLFTWGNRNKLTTSQLRYNLKTQDLSSDAEVVYTWGRGNTMRGPGLRANIKSGDVALQSKADVTFQP